jgi:signal transduction histidine kinase
MKTIKEGGNDIVLSTIRDMTLWLELEKLKTLSHLKTVAFASAAHEFRNPLNAIVSSLDIIENMIDHRAE